MKMLLEREDIASDTPDKSGRTLLSWAAGKRFKDVTPDTLDWNGRAPPSRKAINGHGDVVGVTLSSEDATPIPTAKEI